MKNRVTKKDVQHMINLIKKHGYWSEEVKEFNSTFSYPAMQRLQQKAKVSI